MEQNFKNHARLVTGFHGVLLILLVAGLIGSSVNLYMSLHSPNLYSASLILLLFVCGSIMYALPTGLRLGQIIALRFASDEEFPPLIDRALKDNLTAVEIKKAIKNWKADHYRV